MSELQIILIALGAIIIASVVVYNWLQERKLRENITEEFIVPQKDVLTEEFYIDADALIDKEFEGDARKAAMVSKLNENDNKLEPEPIEKVTPNSQPDVKSDIDVEPKPENSDSDEYAATKDTDDAPSSTTSALPEVETPSDIDVHKDILPAELEQAITSSLPDEVHSQIDLTAFLYTSKNFDGQALQTLAQDTLKDLGAVILLHGLDDNDAWHLVDASAAKSAHYKQVAFSLQLADRRGPVPSPVLNKFQFAVETIGLELNAHVEWQGKGDSAQRAVDLDKFCMNVDQLVSVHLLQGETPIHGTKFKGLAEVHDMELKQGKFCHFKNTSDDFPQFVLVNADEQPFTAENLRTNVVLSATFQMEIPKVENCEQVFNDMIAIAQKMANNLGAHMVDDNQKPLGDLQIEKIRQQLKVIHATMVARGIMPGSAGSMRLFN
ncbi:MAG: cell division protein ZipA C-terminal FtsZ-binding domain-containing protein [Methylophilaceae bacterium]